MINTELTIDWNRTLNACKHGSKFIVLAVVFCLVYWYN